MADKKQRSKGSNRHASNMRRRARKYPKHGGKSSYNRPCGCEFCVTHSRQIYSS